MAADAAGLLQPLLGLMLGLVLLLCLCAKWILASSELYSSVDSVADGTFASSVAAFDVSRSRDGVPVDGSAGWKAPAGLHAAGAAGAEGLGWVTSVEWIWGCSSHGSSALFSAFSGAASACGVFSKSAASSAVWDGGVFVGGSSSSR